MREAFQAFRHVSMGRAQASFSQEGEDLLLLAEYEYQETGTYLDVGAFHPYQYSNTALLYRRGWRGINVDADASACAAFARHRPDEPFHGCLVGRPGGAPVPFYEFQTRALNTMDEARAERLVSEGHRLLRRRYMTPVPLDDMVPFRLDLFLLDVEGAERAVLESFPWDKTRPRAILVEDAYDRWVPVFLRDAGYALKWRTHRNGFYLDREAV